MDFALTASQHALRHEIQHFLRVELGGGYIRPDSGFSRDFSKKAAARRWIGMGWPERYGGLGAGAIERAILTEGRGRQGAATRWARGTGADIPAPQATIARAWRNQLPGGRGRDQEDCMPWPAKRTGKLTRISHGAGSFTR